MLISSEDGSGKGAAAIAAAAEWQIDEVTKHLETISLH